MADPKKKPVDPSLEEAAANNRKLLEQRKAQLKATLIAAAVPSLLGAKASGSRSRSVSPSPTHSPAASPRGSMVVEEGAVGDEGVIDEDAQHAAFLRSQQMAEKRRVEEEQREEQQRREMLEQARANRGDDTLSLAEARKQKEKAQQENEVRKMQRAIPQASVKGLRVWAALRVLQEQGRLGERKSSLFSSTIAAAKKLERDRKRAFGQFQGEALKIHLEKIAVEPNTPWLKRTSHFKALAKQNLGSDNHKLWRLANSNNEKLLCGFDCMKINDKGKLEPRTALLTDRSIYVCLRDDLLHPKRQIAVVDVVGLVEDQFAEAQIGIVCVSSEYDTYLNISEGKENFIASLFLLFREQGRVLHMWEASPLSTYLRLSSSDKGKVVEIPMRRGAHDFLRLHTNISVCEQLMGLDDYTVHFSGACSQPQGMKLCLTDNALCEITGQDKLKINRRVLVKHLKYLVESREDPDYMTFCSNDPEAPEFEFWTDMKPFVIEYFRKVRPDLEIVDLSDHAERMEFEAEKAEFEAELEEEERKAELQREERIKQLLAEQEKKAEKQKEKEIQEAVEKARAEMMKEITAREEVMIRQIEEYEASQQKGRDGESKEAAEMLGGLRRELEEEKNLRLTAAHYASQRKLQHSADVRQRRDMDDAIEKLQSGTTPQYLLSNLHRDLQSEKEKTQKELAPLRENVVQLEQKIVDSKKEKEDLGRQMARLQETLRRLEDQLASVREERRVTASTSTAELEALKKATELLPPPKPLIRPIPCGCAKARMELTAQLPDMKRSIVEELEMALNHADGNTGREIERVLGTSELQLKWADLLRRQLENYSSNVAENKVAAKLREVATRVDARRDTWQKERVEVESIAKDLERQAEKQAAARERKAKATTATAENEEKINEVRQQLRAVQQRRQAMPAGTAVTERSLPPAPVVQDDTAWLQDVLRQRQALQASLNNRPMVFSRFRASCYSASPDRDTLTSTAPSNTVAICNRLLHDGRHRWRIRSSNGNLKCGIAMHAITVLNLAGAHTSWVLTKNGQLMHNNETRDFISPLQPRDEVTLVLDFDQHDGCLMIGLQDKEPQVAFSGIGNSGPFVPVVELYTRGDVCCIVSYEEL